jgi:hypothetical protein
MVVHELWGISPGRFRRRRLGRFAEDEWQIALKLKRSYEERGYEELRLTTRHIDLDDEEDEEE